MPTMLDFSITQVYRLITNDLLMMWDAWVLYKKYKKTGRSIKEYSEVYRFALFCRCHSCFQVLANLMDVESENFEEIKLRSKLGNADNAHVTVIIWDFLHEIIIKHFIDDVSQYPFWMAKVAITTEPQAFGMAAVHKCLDYLRNTVAVKGVFGLYEVLCQLNHSIAVIGLIRVWYRICGLLQFSTIGTFSPRPMSSL